MARLASPNLKLSHQGLILVFILLAIEFCFVGGLFHLLSEAEKEARREEHLRQVIVATNRLIELNYVAIYAVRDFVSTRDTFHEKKYIRSCDEMKKELDWLDKNLADQPYQRELVNRIRSKFNVAFQVADRAREIFEEGGSIMELSALLKAKGEFHELNKQLVPDFQDLLRAQRRIEEIAPQKQRNFREQAKTFLLIGVVLNVVIAIAMAVFFTRGIISRLEVVVDNTKRLKEGNALREPLEGQDEIAKLDQVFHEMASELNEASRKERMALSEAKEAEARIRQVTNSMPVGLFIVDKSGTILFANPSAASMLEFSTSDLRGMYFATFITHPDSVKGENNIAKLYEELADKSIEVRAQKRSGQQVDIDLSITPFDARGDKRFLITLLDITERLEIQRMRQAFIAMVSHELRTPLNSVQGYLELLEMGALGSVSTEANDGARRAGKNIDRLVALINDLLDLEKLESGTIALNQAQCDADEIIENSVSAVHDLAEKKGVKIVVAPILGSTAEGTDGDDDGDWAHGSWDQERVVQVVVNLLSNALKFSPEGAVINVSVERVDSYGKPQMEVSVTDEGPGVPLQFRNVIFERFQQVTGSDTHQKGGTGLGLAICKAIVEQHGGTIGVDCDREKGSRFWFRLRLDGFDGLSNEDMASV